MIWDLYFVLSFGETTDVVSGWPALYVFTSRLLRLFHSSVGSFAVISCCFFSGHPLGHFRSSIRSFWIVHWIFSDGLFRLFWVVYWVFFWLSVGSFPVIFLLSIRSFLVIHLIFLRRTLDFLGGHPLSLFRSSVWSSRVDRWLILDGSLDLLGSSVRSFWVVLRIFFWSSGTSFSGHPLDLYGSSIRSFLSRPLSIFGWSVWSFLVIS